MTSKRHVALLRGINVGGKNVIRMSDLRACFEKAGFTDVETYIQSGNVVFSTPRASAAKLTDTIEEALSHAFEYDSRVCVLESAHFRRVVEEAPVGFGKDSERYRYDVLFVMPPMKPGEVFQQLSTRPGVDTAHAGSAALYFRRRVSRSAQSHLNRLAQSPVYKHLTVRNWNTTTRLLALVERVPN